MVWTDKRDVKLLTTFHDTTMTDTGKVHPVTKEPIVKPQVVVEYNKHMGGVDTSDFMSSTYADMRKTCKWYKKLAFHLGDLSMTNAFVLYKYVCHKPKANHCDFLVHVASSLIKEGVDAPSDRPMPMRKGRQFTNDAPLRLVYKYSEHWPAFIQPSTNAKKANPTRPCTVCKLPSSGRRTVAGDRSPRPETRYWCPPCNVGLHPQCFKAYHTRKTYQ